MSIELKDKIENVNSVNEKEKTIELKEPQLNLVTGGYCKDTGDNPIVIPDFLKK